MLLKHVTMIIHDISLYKLTKFFEKAENTIKEKPNEETRFRSAEKKIHLHSSTLTKGPVHYHYLLTTFPSINRSKVPLLPNKKGKSEYSWWTCKLV